MVAHIDPGACLWCQRPMRPSRRHGSQRKFCSSTCRMAFWRAARAWVASLIETGHLPVEAIRAHSRSVHALPEGDKGEREVA